MGEAQTDGGAPVESDVFTRTADVEPASRQQRIVRKLDAYIYAPLAVAVDDIRTLVGGGILLLFFFASTFGVVLVDPPKMMEGPLFLKPFQDIAFPLGTSSMGKDLFAQLVHSSPAMLKMILAGAFFSMFVGTLIGTIAGYKGGKVDKVLMSFTDVVLTIPGLALIIVLASVYPPKAPIVVGLVLGIDNWPRLARTIRSQVLSIREEPFTEASRIMGLSEWTILRRDLVSNLMPYILINFANSSRRIIFESVGLYFLGILPFTTLNWGVMMNEAYQDISLTNADRLYVILIPMIAIVILALGFMLFAQGLDRVFNVRLRARHAKTVGEDEDS